MRADKRVWSRRRVLQAAGSLAALSGVDRMAWAERTSIALVLDRQDALAKAREVQWAADELQSALSSRGAKVLRCESLPQASSAQWAVLVAGASNPVVRSVLRSAETQLAETPEALAIARGAVEGKNVLAVTGSDARGLMYALLDLADEAALEQSPTAALIGAKNRAERPANKVRSLTRLFTSDVEDKPWYNDRAMWPQYLAMLARQRFNRFNLAFGIGYDFIRQVTDAYFLFTYPFLLDVPGYHVTATNLPASERDANLAMLKYIARETVAHGLEFHVGLWMHGYVWIDSPHPNHVIEGITKENHGEYCRDALRMLLTEVPQISGVTFRIHGESGVNEGSYDFWKKVFDGVATCGRKVSIDMHAKGMDETMIQLALATAQHVQISPKYWGEHLGMPYHQSDIRIMEQPKADAADRGGLMKFSAGTRSFLRYGYGDLLREDRKWSVVHRVWPGTQRLLLWGDPVSAAAYSRAFGFCGSDGVEIMEMLSFKGRRGSGIAGNRTAYADSTLAPRWDWQKYEYTSRVWGRMLYNPETAHEVFERSLQKDFGPGAGEVCTALAEASRILPAVFTCYAPSAGNNTYWPELYWNESYVDTEHPGPYSDSPKPVSFQTASSFDPPMFSRMTDCAAELLGAASSGKSSPIDVAQWLEEYALAAKAAWEHAEAKASSRQTPEYRRMALDIALQIGLGRFFAARFRSGVLFAIYEQTQDHRALESSLHLYKQSRDTWAAFAALAKDAYQSDITVGEEPYLRGHWIDRIPAMEKDIALLEERLADAKSGNGARVTAAIAAALGKPAHQPVRASHTPAATFRAGAPLEVRLSVKGASRVTLHYRHVNQAERYLTVAMESIAGAHTAEIPASYTDSEYPLEYFFEVVLAGGETRLFPGFEPARFTQPYFVVRRA